jgi:hypothetical protein
MHQQLWGYKVQEKMYLGDRERKKWIMTAVERSPLARPFEAIKLTV